MIIDLKHIFVNDNSSLEIDYSMDMSSVDYMNICPLKAPVKIVGKVFNKASLVRLKAHIVYQYEAPCDRCGVIVSHEHTISVDKSLAISIENEESDSILLVPDMKINIDELVYSEVISNFPMKHLCREDCKGLCSKCGKNLNEGKCDCSDKEVDPRLSALTELLNNE